MTTAERIKKRREELGLTNGQLAEMVGATESMVSRWQSQQKPNVPSVRYRPKLAKALGGKPADYGQGEDRRRGEHAELLESHENIRRLLEILVKRLPDE